MADHAVRAMSSFPFAENYYYGIPYSNDMDEINGTTCCPGKRYWAQYQSDDINSDNYNVPIIENTKITERPANQKTITKRFTDKAIDFIDKNKDDNFFIYLAHSMPHTPLYASENFYGKSLLVKFLLLYVHHIATASIFIAISIYEHARMIWTRSGILLICLFIIIFLSVLFNAPLPASRYISFIPKN